jgi:hypothetical protein
MTASFRISLLDARAEKFFHLYQAEERTCLVSLQQNTIG